MAKNRLVLPAISGENMKDAKSFLEDFRKKYDAKAVLGALDSVKDTRVLLIGDAILDEYTFCRQMDRAGKEALFAYRELQSETHAGGVFAVANHLAQFSDNVYAISCIGNNHNQFVNNSLDRNVRANIFVQNGASTLTKKRYIDDYKRQKLFEVYNAEALEPSPEVEEEMLDKFKETSAEADLVVVADFGHGLITKRLKDALTSGKKYLAVNTQLNGGNQGFNFVTNYPRADFVSLNDRELRLPLQDRNGDIKEPIKRLAEMIGLSSANITLGKNGCMYFREGRFYPTPTFTKNPVDTIGAGDAVLSITSLLSYKEVDPQITAFLGNCVGTLAVKIVGNRSSVKRKDLDDLVEELLS